MSDELEILITRLGSLAAVADALGKSERQVRRWQAGDTAEPSWVRSRCAQLLTPRVGAPDERFTFIDLFAGIGGTRLGFEGAGGKCVFTSEWDRFAQQTYQANFGVQLGHRYAGNITDVHANDVPDHDVLVGGFPCQPFSIAGVSKKNSLGRLHGFSDATQGTLFFDVLRLLKEKRPAAFVLENVKNLKSHDRGRTFEVIRRSLQDELGYEFHYRVIDSRPWVPQARRRIFMVGFREPTKFSFDDVEMPSTEPTMSSVLHPEDGSEIACPPYTNDDGVVAAKYTLTSHLWTYLQGYAIKHRTAGNGFGYGVVDRNSVARTLSARYYKDGSEILVAQGPRKRPRRLTPRECARLMGFDDSFAIPVSDTQAYKQFGNSVVVPLVTAVAHAVRPHVERIVAPAAA
ncbi:DNA (cytosine-5-)-methyltransferase [Naumannella huperziae]